jgi:hypothetical protein
LEVSVKSISDKSNRELPDKSDDVLHRVPGDHDRGEANLPIASISPLGMGLRTLHGHDTNDEFSG